MGRMSPDNDDPDNDQGPPQEPPPEEGPAPAEPHPQHGAPDEAPPADDWETAEQSDVPPASAPHDETVHAAAPEEDDEEEEGEEDDDEDDDEQEDELEEEEEAARARPEITRVRYEPEEAPAEVFGEPDPFYQPSAFDREPPLPPPRPTYTPPPRVAAVEEED